MFKRVPSFLRHDGSGVITGTADDDPSHTREDAQFGTGLLWTVFLSLPFMISIQQVSARIGRVTGKGVAANLREHPPRWFLMTMVALLVVANTINITADIAAMGYALQLAVGGNGRVLNQLHQISAWRAGNWQTGGSLPESRSGPSWARPRKWCCA